MTSIDIYSTHFKTMPSVCRSEKSESQSPNAQLHRPDLFFGLYRFNGRQGSVVFQVSTYRFRLFRLLVTSSWTHEVEYVWRAGELRDLLQEQKMLILVWMTDQPHSKQRLQVEGNHAKSWKTMQNHAEFLFGASAHADSVRPCGGTPSFRTVKNPCHRVAQRNSEIDTAKLLGRGWYVATIQGTEPYLGKAQLSWQPDAIRLYRFFATWKWHVSVQRNLRLWQSLINM